ncbi:MAG TPA: UDP-N-acetylmuramoyl-tripeptide--D-alanyl-D-alanine ligase [Terriglobia bacterium]|nr:UDP-N-acetylmuramoyl-tripeptide--D-alanyl-D-alanine ligase [Terriglobia bacterium]
MQLTLTQIAALLGAPAPEDAARPVAGYSIDSRTIRPGELFFAVRGQRLDGHQFVVSALCNGAVAAVVSAERAGAFPQEVQPRLLAVPDTLAALHVLAAGVRQRWGGPVVAITGSAGKTTTKQMIAALLRTRFRTLENSGNWNNQFGLPLSLLRLDPEHEIGVFELGMSAPGEIRLLAGLARPDVGVVTNVSAAHLEFFPNVQAIARAKRELVESLGNGDWAVLNADDPRVAAFGAHSRSAAFYFGLSDAADLRASDLRSCPEGGYRFRVHAPAHRSESCGAAWKGRRAAEFPPPCSPATELYLPLLGRHSVSNLLAALSVAWLFGISPAELTAAVSALRPAPQRGELVRLASGALVVDDTYNSNPAALEAMLEAVAEIPAAKHYAVLGGMMELGAASEQLHYRCGRRAAELGYAGLITVGEAARPLAAGARAAGLPDAAIAHCAATEEAGERLRGWMERGDVALLKASRAVRLETIWNHLGPRAAEQASPVGAGTAAGCRGEGV